MMETHSEYNDLLFAGLAHDARRASNFTDLIILLPKEIYHSYELL